MEFMSIVCEILDNIPEEVNNIDYSINARSESLQHELLAILKKMPLKNWESLGYPNVKSVEFITTRRWVTNIYSEEWNGEWELYICAKISYSDNATVEFCPNAYKIIWEFAKIDKEYNLFCKKILRLQRDRLNKHIQFEESKKKTKLTKAKLKKIVKEYSDYSLYTYYFNRFDCLNEFIDYIQDKNIVDEFEIARLKKVFVLVHLCSILKNIDKYKTNKEMASLYEYWKGAEKENSELYSFINEYLEQQNTINTIVKAANSALDRCIVEFSKEENYLFSKIFRNIYFKELIYKDRKKFYSVRLTDILRKRMAQDAIILCYSDNSSESAADPIVDYLRSKKEEIHKLMNARVRDDDCSIIEEYDEESETTKYRLKIDILNYNQLYEYKLAAERDKELYLGDGRALCSILYILENYLEIN